MITCSLNYFEQDNNLQVISFNFSDTVVALHLETPKCDILDIK